MLLSVVKWFIHSFIIALASVVTSFQVRGCAVRTLPLADRLCKPCGSKKKCSNCFYQSLLRQPWEQRKHPPQFENGFTAGGNPNSPIHILNIASKMSSVWPATLSGVISLADVKRGFLNGLWGGGAVRAGTDVINPSDPWLARKWPLPVVIYLLQWQQWRHLVIYCCGISGTTYRLYIKTWSYLTLDVTTDAVDQPLSVMSQV